jgi:hypothetical protein
MNHAKETQAVTLGFSRQLTEKDFGPEGIGPPFRVTLSPLSPL